MVIINTNAVATIIQAVSAALIVDDCATAGVAAVTMIDAASARLNAPVFIFPPCSFLKSLQ